MPSKGPRRPATEQIHSQAWDLDLASPEEIVRRLHREDVRALEATRRALPQIEKAAKLAGAILRGGGRLFYVGAGTSGRLGALDAAECPPTFGVHPSLVRAIIAGGPRAMSRAVEGAEDDGKAGAAAVHKNHVSSRDLVVGISASARTPFVLGALREARRLGAATVLLASLAPEPGGFRPDLLIHINTGAELVAGSTRLKAGTATKLVLNAISTAAMVQLGKVYKGRMVDLKATNQKLKARALGMVQELTGLAPKKAKTLLDSAGGHPRLALVMHWTGLSAASAKRRLHTFNLRGLEPK